MFLQSGHKGNGLSFLHFILHKFMKIKMQTDNEFANPSNNFLIFAVQKYIPYTFVPSYFSILQQNNFNNVHKFNHFQSVFILVLLQHKLFEN